MKREFLEQLGLDKDLIEKIIIEHGKSVQTAKPDDYDVLKEQSKKNAETIQKLEKQLASKNEEYTNFEEEKNTLLAKVKTYETNELKLRIARENNIPFDLAQRLTGETEEELIADAKSLASFVSQKDILPLKEETDTTVDPYTAMVENLEN